MKTLIAAILLLASSQVVGQAKLDDLAGKWITEDNAVMEFSKMGAAMVIRQIEAEKIMDKKYNGKVVGKDVVHESGSEFRGVIVDPSNGKEYKATWNLSANGKRLLLKIKWGLVNFSETWARQ